MEKNIIAARTAAANLAAARLSSTARELIMNGYDNGVDIDLAAEPVIGAIQNNDMSAAEINQLVDELALLVADEHAKNVPAVFGRLDAYIAFLKSEAERAELFESLKRFFIDRNASKPEPEPEDKGTDAVENDDENVHTCANCGCVIEGDVVIVDGDEWCKDCADEGAFQCDHCGEYHSHQHDCEQEVYASDGCLEHWCEACVDEDAFWCDNCETYNEGYSSEVIVRGSGNYGSRYETWCDSCVDSHAAHCSDCDSLFDINNPYFEEYETWDGDTVYLCDDCVDNNWYRCEDCGCLVRDCDTHFSGGSAYCPSCVNDNRENVHGYHHTTCDLTFWIKNDVSKSQYCLDIEDRKTLFLGVELETDDNDDINELADNIIGEFGNERMECKEDGSLSDYGLELVSQPMTPEVHLTSGMWERIIDFVLEQNGRSHDAGTCGLHIHLSRGFFDEGAVYRMDRLFHRFKSQMMKFSRRSERQMHWCRIDEDDLASIKEVEERKKEWKRKKANAGRYEAVNDTNTNTVEIRMWRGTLNVETFRATVELTTGLAYVVNAISDEFADELDWERLKLLVRYALEENGLPHDDLDAYISRREL